MAAAGLATDRRRPPPEPHVSLPLSPQARDAADRLDAARRARRRAEAHRALAERAAAAVQVPEAPSPPARSKILAAITENPGCGVAWITEAARVSTTTARKNLRKLAEDGVIRAEPQGRTTTWWPT